MPIHYKTLAEELSLRGHNITIVYADRFGGPIGCVNNNLNLKTIKFQLPKIIYYPVVSKLIKKIGLTEKLRFHSDSSKIATTVQALNSKEKFDIIESPNNGACFHKFHSLNFKTCIRIATTDKEHSLINKTEISPYLKELFRAEGKTFHNCRNLVTHTKAHRDNICKEYNLRNEKFTLIPLSVKIPKESDLNFTKEAEKKVVLFVGRFEERKGIDVLLNLIPTVLKKEPSAIFKLVGPDTNKYYESKFKKEHPNFTNNVLFLGEKRGVELDQEYKNCDVFIAPSRYESFGLIYAEAMSFAKPVIGTNIGGIPEVIDHKKNGFLCENENLQDFSNKLLTLLENENLRYKMGMLGRKKTKECFDFQKLVSHTEKYYDQIIKKSKN